MHHFHGNCSFYLPISSCWLKAPQRFVLRLQRGERPSLPHPQHGAGDSSKPAGNKSLVFTNNMGSWEEGGRAEKTQSSFSGGKQHFPQCAKVQTHFPALHKSTSNMCLAWFYQNCQLWFAGSKYREEKRTSLEMRNSRAASTQGSLCRIRWRATERAGRPLSHGCLAPCAVSDPL